MRIYKYEIYPYFNKVKAEISAELSGFDLHVLDKSFGSNFRKPIEADYLEAEEWVKKSNEIY